jgi:hypothetical protein
VPAAQALGGSAAPGAVAVTLVTTHTQTLASIAVKKLKRQRSGDLMRRWLCAAVSRGLRNIGLQARCQRRRRTVYWTACSAGEQLS